MEYILSIDDTDNLTSPGTGEHLEEIIKLIEQKGLGKCSRVTRHQLFFSPLVKYTSHNSSMSIIIHTEFDPISIFEIACVYLEQNAAEGSDPGVCLLAIDILTVEQLKELKEYAQKAKKEYIEKDEACLLAAKTGIMLKELGGEGIGIIGALAGAVLRLSGNDGRYKGKIDIGVNQDNMLCKDILSHPYIDLVMTEDGEEIPDDCEIFITDKIKTVNINNKAVLLVKKQKSKDGEVYTNLSKAELKKY